MQGADFVAIDVETANADMASICQVGVAAFVNGRVAAQWKSYVDPEDHFDGINISIHGITPDKVIGAPTFGALFSRIQESIGSRIVVTHTAFDRVALTKACAKCQVVSVACTWIDTACVARRCWVEHSRSGYGLDNICNVIGYKFQHHDALEDAKAAGEVLLAAMARSGLDLNGWLARVRQPIDPTLAHSIVRHGNPEGILHGEVIVFTGALSRLSRSEASDLASKAGCEVDASVTKRTTLLVVGDQDIRLLAGHEKSAKHRRAEELIMQGRKIRILAESDFEAIVSPTMH